MTGEWVSSKLRPHQGDETVDALTPIDAISCEKDECAWRKTQHRSSFRAKAASKWAKPLGSASEGKRSVKGPSLSSRGYGLEVTTFTGTKVDCLVRFEALR